ncbi:acyl-CoA dehydrogenase family protein [Saccharopolyspora taberi]|uniref:Acyl-CoA dehydrogenase n=1 Tax=Saccharopolyspora taberi TaxID=60895 RepID=A0ABN3V9X4_9PSEU
MESTGEGRSETAVATEILEFLRGYAGQRLDSRRMDERRSLPPSLVSDFAAAGLFGLQVPAQYQGLELPHRETLRVVTQLGAIDANLMVLAGVHNTLGTPPVTHFAPERVKKEVLPEVAQGRRLITSAISEPGMGSHVNAITAHAAKRPDGSYVLNGDKQWISLGADAGYVNVFARLHDERGKPIGITGFLVDTATPGFDRGPEVLTLGLKAVPQNRLTFNDLHVAADSLLGAEGEGLAAAKAAFMLGRVTLAAGGLGAMMRATELAHRFARRREVATGLLAENGRIQQILADSAAATQAVETLVQHIGTGLDEDGAVADELLFTAKILGCELMWQVVDSCVQLMGARGYVDTNVVGQFFRDYRLFRIFEGSTEAVTVYLGTTILNKPGKFTALLDELAEPGVRELGAEVVELATATATTNDQQRHVLANAVGNMACWTVLAAVTAAAADGGQMRAYSAAWCERQLRERLRDARSGVAVDLPTSDFLAEHIAGYGASIGDVEQRTLGEQNGMDQLLLRG